jgi:hypothetical protein
MKSKPTKFNTTGTPPYGRNHDHCSFQTPHVSVISSTHEQHPPMPKRSHVITTLQFSPTILPMLVDISFPDKRALTAFQSCSRFKFRPKWNKIHTRHSETPFFYRPIPTRFGDGCASVEISTVGRSIAKPSWSPSSLSAFEKIPGE